MFNAYEKEDGTVIIDAPVHDRVFAETYDGPSDSRFRFERWTLPKGETRVQREVVDQTAQEFPRCNEQHFGKPYRYAYSMSAEHTGEFEGVTNDTRLFKHDMEKRARQVHQFGRGRFPGEFVYVPGGDGEDEGWLIGLVVDMNDETTELVILDAANFEGDPAARIKVPHRVPPGFHGNWVPSS